MTEQDYTRKNRGRRFYPAIIIVGIIILGMTAHGLFGNNRAIARYTPLTDALSGIKSDISVSYLWFREYIHNDSDRSTKKIIDRLETAEHSVDILNRGGNIGGTHIFPIDIENKELRELVSQLQSELETFSDTLQTLLKVTDTVAMASLDEKSLDEKFAGVINKIDRIESEVRTIMAQDLSYINNLQIIMLILGLILLAVLTVLFRRYENRRKEDYEAIGSVNRELDESRTRFSTTLRSIGDGVIATDRKGVITFLNPTAEKLTGYGQSEAIGKPIDSIFCIIDEYTREKVADPVEEVCREGVVVESPDRSLLIARDGTERPIENTGAPIVDNQGRAIGAVLVFSDYSDKRTATRKIEHLNAVLMAIRNVNQLVTKEKDIDRLLSGSCDNLVATRGFLNAWIALIDDEYRVTRFIQAEGNQGCRPRSPLNSDRSLPPCARKALNQSEILIIKGPADVCTQCPLRESIGSEGAITVRLEHDEKTYGVMTVSVRKDLTEFNEEQALINEVAGDIAYALHALESEQKRRQAEAALRESEEKYSSLFQHSNDGIFIHDLEGKILDVNQKVLDQFGYTKDEMLSLRVPELHPQEMKDVSAGAFAHIETDGYVNFEIDFVTKNGDVFPAEVSSSIFEIDGKRVIQGVVRNIANRRKYEKALKDQLQFETLLLELSTTFVNIPCEKVDETINFWLRKLVSYLNVDRITIFRITEDSDFHVYLSSARSPEVVAAQSRQLGGELSRFFSQIKQGKIQKFSSIRELRTEYPKELKYVREHGLKSALTVPLSAGGEIIGALSFVNTREERDWPDDLVKHLQLVSEVFANAVVRRQNEEALQDNEAMLKTIFKTAPIAIGVISNRVIGWINDRVQQMSGYTKAELEGQNVRMIYRDQEEYERIGKEIYAQIKERGIGTTEAQIRCKDGTIIDVLLNLAPLRSDGDSEEMIFTAMDITERKHAIQALKDSEEQYRGIFSSVTDCLIIINHDGDIFNVNESACRTYGYSHEEMTQMNVIDLIHPDYHDGFHKFMTGFETVGTYESEVVHLRKDGSAFNVELGVSRMRIKGQQFLLGIVRDVTERKRAEEELRRVQALLEASIEQTPAGILIADAPDVSIRVANAAALGIRGETADPLVDIPVEMHPKNWQTFYLDGMPYDPADLPLSRAVLKGDVSRDVEVIIRRTDGQDRLVSANAAPVRDTEGNIIAGVVVFQDITEKRQAEEELAREKERLAVTLSSIGDAVIATDRQGNILIFNDLAVKLTGWERDEAIGRPFLEVFHAVDESSAERIDNPIERVLETNEIVSLSGNSILIARDGTERVIADSAAPIKDGRGEIIGVVLVFRDITETKRLQEFAVRAQRLETAGRIAGQVAHDFNNLLGPLVAFPDLVREELPEDHKALNYIASMEKSAMKIADINQQLLTLGRRGHYGQLVINLNNIVRETLEQFESIPNNIEIETDLADDLMNIKGGPAQLLRIISNLILNAFDAMPEGGRLTIRTENFYLEDQIGIQDIIPKGEYVKLSIFDTGAGIPPEVEGRVFDPFFTTKTTDRRRGSGLGLSVVHAVLEDHGGYIDFESSLGQGTRFYLYFPIAREHAGAGERTEHIVGGNEKILVVDDDIVQLDVTRKLLEKLGYRVETSESGEKAIELTEKVNPDLILLDMLMPPGIDGADCLKKILQSRPGQKAIMVSGFARTDRVKTALNLGASAYIRKPLTMKSLAISIREALDQKIKVQKSQFDS